MTIKMSAKTEIEAEVININGLSAGAREEVNSFYDTISNTKARDVVVSKEESPQLWQDKVKELNMSWNVEPKGDKTFAQLAGSKPKNLGLGI